MANENQRIENVVIVAGPEQLPESVPATKMRFWNEDGTPFALKGADNKVRLDGLEERLAALEAAANARVEEGQSDSEPEQPESVPQQ